MTSLTDRLTDREIGQRLRVSRQVAELRQADAAGAIGIARTTLVAIEQGRRRIKTQELQELAFLYGTSANAILRHDAVHLDLVPQFRSLRSSADRKTDGAARLLTELVSARGRAGECSGRQAASELPARESHSPRGRRRSSGA